MTADLRVDRLTLRAGALSEAQARRLAELVGLALGRAPMLAGTHRTVSVTVPAAGADGERSVEQLAEAVVQAIEAALRVDGAAT